MLRFIRNLSLVAFLLAHAGQPVSLLAQSTDHASGADAAWERLTALQSSSSERGAPVGAPTDWVAAGAAARKFLQDYPDHPKARSAVRIELTARIHGEAGNKALSVETASAVAQYLSDARNDVRDRVLLKMLFERTRINQAKPATYEAHLQANAALARELIGGFPDQPDGYGYMLSLSRLAPPGRGMPLAEQLLANELTPARFKAMAGRVAARPALLSQPLRLDGAEAEIARAAGKTLVVYSWRAADKGFLAILKRMAAVPDVAFIGINLDENQAVARVAARDLPGAQFYDGGGLDGPLARQLQLVLNTSVYLVDGQGILRDIDAHRSPRDQLLGFLVMSKGGAR